MTSSISLISVIGTDHPVGGACKAACTCNLEDGGLVEYLKGGEARQKRDALALLHHFMLAAERALFSLPVDHGCRWKM